METIDVVYSDSVKNENDLKEVFANNKGLYVVENDLIFMSLSAIRDNNFVRDVAEGEGLSDYQSAEIMRLSYLATRLLYNL